MSEAELHLLKARLRGGILNRARRGELRLPLPAGLAYAAGGEVVLDPDQRVREALRHLFATFERTGSATGTVKHFRKQGLLFPVLQRGGPCKGRMLWKQLTHDSVLRVLRNPRYAGAFAFGRTRVRHLPDGRKVVRSVPREEWLLLLPGAHPGYVSWERFEANERRLAENARADGPQPVYMCRRGAPEAGSSGPCQTIRGDGADRAVAALLAETVTPAALEVALQVQAELEARRAEADALRARDVQHKRELAETAKQFLLLAKPRHSEAIEELMTALRAWREAQERLDRFRARVGPQLGEGERARIRALASDFPRLWNDPATPHRERKRLARLLLADVTLTPRERIEIGVRWRGGATQSLSVARPPRACDLRRTDPQVIAEIDALLDRLPTGEIADELNRRQRVTGTGLAFTAIKVQQLCANYGLRKRYHRLREKGLLTQAEIAGQLGVCEATVRRWRRAGLLCGHVFNDKGQCLYEDPGDHPPLKRPGSNLSKRLRPASLVRDPSQRMQSDA